MWKSLKYVLFIFLIAGISSRAQAAVHVPFTLNNSNHSASELSSSSNVEWNGTGNYYKLGNGTWIGTRPDDYVVIALEGIPETLSFSINCEKAGIGLIKYYPAYNDYEFLVYESATGEEEEDEWRLLDWGFDNSNGFESAYLGANEAKRHVQVSLSPTTRYIKLRYHGSCWGRYENIQVTELHSFSLNPSSVLDFGTEGLIYGEQTQLVAFNFANAGTTTTSITGPDADYFRVSPAVVPGTGADQYGTAYIAVVFDNVLDGVMNDKGNNAYSATLTVEDDANRIDLALTGKRFGKTNPQFTFNPNNLPYYFNTSIANVASSSNTDPHCPLTYESSHPEIAQVVNGRLEIYDAVNPAPEVTITVKQENGNTDYNSGYQSFTFTPRTVPSLLVPFRLTEALYNAEAEPLDASYCIWNSSSEDPDDIRLGNGKGWQFGTGWGVWGFTMVFSNTPDKVSFQYRASRTTVTHDISMAAPHFLIIESSNGMVWDTAWFKKDNKTAWSETLEVQLKPTTQYLRFLYDGNYYAFYKNIKVTELIGYKYLRAENGKYLSRGAKWATQAVTDAFGIPCRITNETEDNANIYTQFQYVDSKEYLYETSTEIFTDNATGSSDQYLWQITNDGGILTLQSANTLYGKKGYYVTQNNDVVELTADAASATQWVMEDYTEHGLYMDAIFNAQAAAAARNEFGASVNTRGKVHNSLTTEDFNFYPVSIETVVAAERSGEAEFRDGEAGARPVYDYVVNDLTPGFYIVSAKALFRISPSDNAWDNHERGTESVVAYVYANDVKYPIQSLYSSWHGAPIASSDESHGGGYYSTTLSSAQTAFDDANRYNNDIYVLVEADPGKSTGTIRYGIKCPSYVPGSWLAYEGVTLTRVARKQYIFINSSNNGDWQTDSNWNCNDQPNIHHEVIIRSNLTLDEEVAAFSLKIENDAIVTISPNGGLKIGAGGVIGATKDNFKIAAAQSGSDKGKTGYLKVSPDFTGTMPTATMEMYSIAYFNMDPAYRDNDDASWQYIGSPMGAGIAAKTAFPNSWVYNWDETSGEWKNNRRTLVLQPFEGYATSQYSNSDGLLVAHEGQLAAQGNQLLNLSYTATSAKPGLNVFANSYAAPIDITKFQPSDFSTGVEATIYLFNTGSKNDVADREGQAEDINTAGQYFAMPVGALSSLSSLISAGYPAVIPSMQGFFLQTDRPGTLNLNYERLVWNTTSSPAPLRAPQREEDQAGLLAISLTANGWADQLYLLEKENYSNDFENGYDAHKIMSGTMNIFAIEGSDSLAVDARDNIIGTRVGVRTGNETAYTMVFSHLNSENGLLLWDIEADEKIAIREGDRYTFFAEPNSIIADRFVIVEAEAPMVTTGVINDGLNDGMRKASKFIKDNQLYILKNGVLYNSTGAVVWK